MGLDGGWMDSVKWDGGWMDSVKWDGGWMDVGWMM